MRFLGIWVWLGMVVVVGCGGMLAEVVSQYGWRRG